LDTAAIRIAECLSHFLQKLAEEYEIWHRLSGFEPGEGVTKKKENLTPPELSIKMKPKSLRLV